MGSSSIHHLALYVALLVVTSINLSLAVDKTLEEKSVGSDVVEAAVEKIRRAQIFDEDYEFLRRLAYVATKDGADSDTFRPNFYGGLWEVIERYFDNSKNTSLSSWHDKIKEEFQIDWQSMTWNDLLKPLHSALAARLFLLINGERIPQTIKEQASYWVRHYANLDSDTEDTYIIAVEELINSTAVCSGKMDLVIALDGSSSVNLNNPNNFDMAKRFVVDLIGTYSLENVRSGLIVFSSIPYPIFDLNNNLTLAEIRNKTLSVRYPDEQTNTNETLIVAHKMFQTATPRHGVPQVFTIFTDGKSKPHGVSAISLLEDFKVSSYVIGITDQVNSTELVELAYGIPSNVFTINNFEILAEFFKRLNTETCKLPQKPEMDSPVQDSLNQNERRYYSLQVPESGTTVSIETSEGEVTGYYSFEEPNPSSAINDGSLFYAGTFIMPRDDGSGSEDDFRVPMANETVYVSVQGLKSVNKYTLKAITGYAVGSTTTTTTTEASVGHLQAGAWVAAVGLLFLTVFSH